MFSALKFVAAGVIVALFGGFLLAGVLTTPQEGETPPAAASASPTGIATSDAVSHAPAIFNGRSGGGRQTGWPTRTDVDGRLLSAGAQWEEQLTEMDDPRLNGTHQIVWHEAYVVGEHLYSVITGTSRIDNEHGSWVGVQRGYVHPTRGYNWQGLLEGQGAYEGLSALMFSDHDGSAYEMHGIIFPGEMPEALPAPEPVAATE